MFRKTNVNYGWMVALSSCLIALAGCGKTDSSRNSSESNDQTAETSAERTKKHREQVKKVDGQRHQQTRMFKANSGLTFHYPKSWQVQSANGGSVIVPADVEKDANGQPLELVMIGSENASGVSDINDPQILQFLDHSIKQIFPNFSRDGDPRSTATPLGQGIVAEFGGPTPTGIDGKAIVYATLHQGQGIFLIHLGKRECVNDRQAESRAIFESFDWQQGQADGKLVGTWRRRESASSGIDSRGYVGGTTTKTWVFAADGKAAYGVGTAIYGGSGSISIDPGQSRNVSQGTWSVRGNQLTVVWSNGSTSRYEYRVFPHIDNQTGLKLIPAGSDTKLYFIKQ